MADEKRTGRPSTGRVVKLKSGPHAGQLQGIITLVDGTTARLPPFPRGTSMAMAKDKTLAKQEAARAQGLTKPQPAGVPSPSGGDAWWDSFFAHREARGLTPTRPAYRQHVKPILGDKHPRDYTRADCEAIVTALDAKITSGAITWKTAANAWGLFTKACKMACSAKAGAGLRVRDDNPTAGVEGPDRGERKEKQWLYPSEMTRLLTCPRVPLRWRRLYALLAYTYVRPSELRVLTWSDVDLDVGTIRVTKAWDRERKREKAPKTRAGVRTVPIEAALRPLLEALRPAHGSGPVFVMPPIESLASQFRVHLGRAGIDRSELFRDSTTHKQITLYDLRATGITWRCLRQDYGPEIQQAAGHEKYDTTDGYIRTARVFVGRVGSPFPSLPSSVVEGFDHEFRSESAQVLGMFASPTGFEPVLQP
jgi:integrase